MSTRLSGVTVEWEEFPGDGFGRTYAMLPVPTKGSYINLPGADWNPRIQMGTKRWDRHPYQSLVRH